MRTLILLVAVAAAATAQPHPGPILAGAGYPLPTDQNYLQGHYAIDWQTGALSTFVDTVSGAGKPNYFWGSGMDVDNRSLVFGTAAQSGPWNINFGVFRYDPRTNTYATLAHDPSNIFTTFGVIPDENGDYFFTARSQPPNFWNLFKVEPAANYSTFLSTVALGHKLSMHYPIRRDVDTGEILLPTSGTITPGLVEHPVYRVAADGSFATFNWSAHGIKPSWGWTQEIASGDLIYQFANDLFRLAPGSSPQQRITTLHAPLSPEYAYGIVYDNQAQASPQLIAYSRYQRSFQSTVHLRWLDPQTGALTRTVNVIRTSTFSPIPYPHRHIAQYATRYVHTVRTAPGVWDVLINFPTRPGRRYAIAATASGIRPGITLADGRRLWANPDAVLFATAANVLPGVWNPGPLVLDANGSARGRIDLSALPRPLGRVLHLVAIVLDPAAPLGIAFVTEPFPMRV